MAERPLFDPSRIAPPDEPRPTTVPATLTPSRVNELIRGAVNRFVPSTLHVLGEMGDLSRAGSGHLYFTLKDEQGELRCVMWRSAAIKLKFELTAGMELIATGGIEVYSPRGTYQLVVRSLEPRGTGALELAFRQLKEKLEREGLFDPRRKRSLSYIPRRLALVTSPTGAAIRDILQTLARRYAAVEVLLAPVRVQGDGAAAEIARAIHLVNRNSSALGGVDALIIGRGGGSLEDLWAFNEEIVARAIAASTIPVVSAVGHEVDMTISDLVADVRAATPTAAAELVTPSRSELVTQAVRLVQRATRAVERGLERARTCVARIAASDAVQRPLRRLREQAQRLDERASRLAAARLRQFSHEHLRLARAEAAIARFGAGASFARLGKQIDARLFRLRIALGQRQSAAQRRLSTVEARLSASAPASTVQRTADRLSSLRARLSAAATNTIVRSREQLSSADAVLTACDPRNILRRGYSITRVAATRRILRSPDQVRPGTRIVAELADGELHSTVDDPRQPGLFDGMSR